MTKKQAMATLKGKDILRRVRITPYRKGQGPTFALTTWDTGRTIDNKSLLGYRLTMRAGDLKGSKIIFEGEDFGCSPMHGIDSDEAVESIMCFLTIQPGDTDPEYFANYTPAQLEYCGQHAEALSGEVRARF